MRLQFSPPDGISLIDIMRADVLVRQKIAPGVVIKAQTCTIRHDALEVVIENNGFLAMRLPQATCLYVSLKMFVNSQRDSPEARCTNSKPSRPDSSARSWKFRPVEPLYFAPEESALMADFVPTVDWLRLEDVQSAVVKSSHDYPNRISIEVGTYFCSMLSPIGFIRLLFVV